MAKTNKRMGGMELLNKALGAKKDAENKLAMFGASLRPKKKLPIRNYAQQNKAGYTKGAPPKNI